MIFNELNTPFPFYDSIDKQNRYRNNCENINNFSLICPINTMLPFQFIAENDGTFTINSWYVKSTEDDSTIYDLTSYIGTYLSIDYFGTESYTYITYDGTSIFGQDFDCGQYYITITITGDTDSYTFYSEVYNVQNIGNATFAQDDFDLFTLWRFKLEDNLLTHNLRNCKDLCDFTLITGNDALLPFQFRIPTGGAKNIDLWTLVSSDDSCDGNSYILSNDYGTGTYITITTIGDYDYVYYNADRAFDDPLECGIFTCILTIDGVNYTSEKIKIINTVDTFIETNYLLQENGSLILQETNFGILLE